jgi:Mn2+/Fe2+ NRAMP family transporter
VIDAYPRSLAVTQHLLQRDVRSRDRRLHAAWMVGTCLVALVMIHSFSGRFTQLVDLATTIAFLAAPVFAALNMRLVASPALSDAHRPGPVLRGLAVAGMVFLVGFSLIYLAQRFVPTVWSGP